MTIITTSTKHISSTVIYSNIFHVTTDLPIKLKMGMMNNSTFLIRPNIQVILEYTKGIYIWLVPLMVFILAIAVVGNGIIVLSASWLSRPINPYHRLCVNLAAADMWAATLLAMGLILNSYLPVVLEIKSSSGCLAALLEIFRISGMLTSNLHIFALAVHQFVGIVYPLKYKLILTTRRQRILIFILWLLPLLFIFTWFIAIPNDGFRHPICRMSFYVRLPFRLSVFISFVVPLCATFVLYTIILFTLMKAKAKCNTDLRRSMHNNYRKRVKSNIKLVWTTLLILSTFTLSWGLCVLYFVLVCVNGCPFIYQISVNYQVGIVLNSTVNFLVMLKLVFNPLIYALRMKHIRRNVILFLRNTCICFKNLRPSSSVTNLTTNNYNITYAPTTDRRKSNNHVSLRRSNSESNQCYAIKLKSVKLKSGVATIEETIEAMKPDHKDKHESIQLLETQTHRRRIRKFVSTEFWAESDSDS